MSVKLIKTNVWFAVINVEKNVFKNTSSINKKKTARLSHFFNQIIQLTLNSHF